MICVTIKGNRDTACEYATRNNVRIAEFMTTQRDTDTTIFKVERTYGDAINRWYAADRPRTRQREHVIVHVPLGGVLSWWIELNPPRP